MCPCRGGGKDKWRWQKFGVVENGVTKKGADMSGYSKVWAINSPRTSEQDRCFSDCLNRKEEIPKAFICHQYGQCVYSYCYVQCCASQEIKMWLHLSLHSWSIIFAFATYFKAFTYPDTRGSQIQQDLCPTYALSFESKKSALLKAWLCYMCHRGQTTIHLWFSSQS